MQIKDHNIQILNIDTKTVEWDQIINNSVFRIPPFEKNSKEKGFRDSIIAETLNQLILSAPKTSKTCRIAFVCADNLLNEAAKAKAKANNNVRFVNDLNELKGLINILVSETEETIINAISKSATELFFIPKDEETFYYKNKISDKIFEMYKDHLFEKPDDITTKVNPGTWYISPVNFVKKEKQRVFWSTSVQVQLISYKNEFTTITSPTGSTKLLYPITGYSAYGSTQMFPKFGLSELLSNKVPEKKSEEVEYLKGKSKYEVIWSITVTTNGKLLNPKLEDIKFIENSWNTE